MNFALWIKSSTHHAAWWISTMVDTINTLTIKILNQHPSFTCCEQIKRNRGSTVEVITKHIDLHVTSCSYQNGKILFATNV